MTIKIKLYIYPQAKEHVHDNDPNYNGVVPFSKYHMDQFEFTTPENADIIYMGQISDSTPTQLDYEYLNQFREKHWVDIEGDWLNREIPQEFDGINLTINGCPRNILPRFRQIFVRPTFSTYLMNALKRNEEFGLPSNKSFGFQGYPDPFGLRHRLKAIVAHFPNEYILTNKWNGPASVGGDEHNSYEQLMLRHIFHICPRGCGHDSVRFFESCFLGRIPVVIGNNILFGELDGLDISFAFRISQYLPNQMIESQLRYILTTSKSEIIDRCYRAKLYWNEVKKYFDNPTTYFLRKKYGLSI